MKKRKLIIISLIVFVVALLCAWGYYSYQKKKNEEKIQDIKSHYSSFVSVLNESNLYVLSDNQYEKIGHVKDGFTFVLEDVEIKEASQEYFQIKNEDYYVYYKDVESVEESDSTSVKDYYLSSNSRIFTKESTKFYESDEFILTLNRELDFSYVSQDENYYQVQYLGKILNLKKEEVELSKQEEKEHSIFVPVLQFQQLKENCNDSSCISVDRARNVLKYVVEKGFYTISNDDYELWGKEYVFLKPGAMLIHFNVVDGVVNSLLEEFGLQNLKDESFKYLGNNQSAKIGNLKDSLNSYVINQNTTDEHLAKIVSGEEVVLLKPKVSKSSDSVKSLPGMDAKATNIAVLNYHFFYANGESCGSGICLEINKFREQLQYLKDNNYKTLTMEEYRAWIYGEIELPARSVLLTIDDGAMGTGKHNGNKLIPMLEEFDMHATLFLISGWWAKDNYISKNLDIESHTFDMHTEKLCSTETRGAQMLCSSKEQVMEDLKKSIQVIGSNTAFCFPFYAYNDSAIQSVKESGFKLAFIGGNRKSNRSNDKYKIPRYPIYDSTSLNDFINMIN